MVIYLFLTVLGGPGSAAVKTAGSTVKGLEMSRSQEQKGIRGQAWKSRAEWDWVDSLRVPKAGSQHSLLWRLGLSQQATEVMGQSPKSWPLCWAQKEAGDELSKWNKEFWSATSNWLARMLKGDAAGREVGRRGLGTPEQIWGLEYGVEWAGISSWEERSDIFRECWEKRPWGWHWNHTMSTN